MQRTFLLAALVLAGCATLPPPGRVYAPQPVLVAAGPAAPQGVALYVEPPLYQPAPVGVAWAPPPLLVDLPPPQPFAGSVWIGGYWVWRGDWLWARGRWVAPPRPGYRWVHPYYEHRQGFVIFVDGFWAAPGVSFVAPRAHMEIPLAAVAGGAVAGPRPMGPEGVFVPPPPGSRHGLIVPAPVGTAPAVVSGAPPIVRDGMRVTADTRSPSGTAAHFIVVAPGGSTANGQSVNVAVPAPDHGESGAHAPPGAHTSRPTADGTAPPQAPVAPRPPMYQPPIHTTAGQTGQPVPPAAAPRMPVPPAITATEGAVPSRAVPGAAPPSPRPAAVVPDAPNRRPDHHDIPAGTGPAPATAGAVPSRTATPAQAAPAPAATGPSRRATGNTDPREEGRHHPADR